MPRRLRGARIFRLRRPLATVQLILTSSVEQGLLRHSRGMAPLEVALLRDGGTSSMEQILPCQSRGTPPLEVALLRDEEEMLGQASQQHLGTPHVIWDLRARGGEAYGPHSLEGVDHGH
jgi:hypothetical protein